MPPSPPSLAISHLSSASRTRPALLCLRCQPPLRRRLQQTRSFHPTRRRFQDAFPNHYDTLDLPSNATSGEIKKQFYSLSKQYHPDLNKAASASARFVKISEAYHVLGSAEKKDRYDRDLQRATGSASSQGAAAPGRSGSYTSASTRSPAGGRPASGLSKRRTQFRGPPPSFYAQGGYGGTEEHRARAQEEAEQRGYTSQRAGGLGGQPPFQGTGGYAEFDMNDPELPYFDREGHRRTHEGLEARRERMGGFGSGGGGGGNRKKAGPEDVGGSDLFLFLVLSAMLASTALLGSVFSSSASAVVGGSPQPRRRGDG